MTDKPLFTGEDLIFAYTRAEALADGVLRDITKLAQEAGFRHPTVMSAAAWAATVEPPGDCPGQSVEGRAWDVLQVLRLRAKEAGQTERVDFVVYVKQNAVTWRDVALKALVHPGDEGEPVITVMLPGED